MLERLRHLPRALAFVFAGTIATRLGAFVVPYLTLYLSQERGLSLTSVGRIVAAGGVGLLVGNLLGGQLADGVGRKATLLTAGVLNMVGTAMLWTIHGSDAAYALCLAVALCGTGMYTPAANALIADLTDEAARPWAFTIHYVCINVGMGLGPLLGGALAASSYAWVFAGDIGASAVCVALIAVGVRSTTPPRPVGAPRDAASALQIWARYPTGVAFAAASLFVVAPLMGLETTVPLLVGVTFGAPLVLVGVVYSINAACILALSFPVERMLRGRDEAAMMALAGVLWAAGLGILAAGFSIFALLTSTIVWTTGEIVASIVIPTYLSKHVAGSARARMLALQDAVRSASAIACPLVVGILWDEAGVRAALALLVALPVCGVVVYAAWWQLGWRRAS